MQASGTPTLVPLPFAANGTKNTIPEASQITVTPGAASLNDGFPPLTFTPIAAGGVPPSGADFNGVLNLITQTIRWKHAGGMFAYNSAFANDPNVGGYPKGALLAKVANNGFWMSTVDNNVTNPDTGGAGWTDPLAGRLLRRTLITSSQTFATLAGTSFIRITASGGGGAGGSAPINASGVVTTCSGGAAGSSLQADFSSTTFNLASLVCTIGAGGTAVAGNQGGTGGLTSVVAAGTTLVTAPGGGGGPVAQFTATTAAGFAAQGIPGAKATAAPGAANVIAAAGHAGQSGLAFAGLPLSGTGSDSCFGGGGGGANVSNGAGGGAQAMGAGGGGAGNTSTTIAQTGGNAAAGFILVEEYA
jgi:hypothetical protein